VSCTAGPDGYLLDVEGVGELGVSADGRQVVQLSQQGSPDRDSVVETMLGPGLVLALAIKGTWSWHAAAILAGRQAVIFLGESGSGKSTLAAYLGRAEQDAWQRLADDVLPLRLAGAGPRVLPHFPQLKVPPLEQPGPAQPETLPLGAIYVLAESEAAEPQIAALAMQEATLALVRHTVAARLFDQELLADHLAFCARLAASVPVRRLRYQRSFDSLPRVGQAIAADLNA
jgi:hypothetical protein